jgi:serine/threonine protein kinase
MTQRTSSSAQQARAESPSHGPVFRKRLDDDCLLDRQLHPSIAERLNRVRELPVSNVANFHGVEVDADGVWLVWQYIEGVTLEQHLSTPRPQADRAALARELRLAVAALHAHGIVHGAIHARNVIVDPKGALFLTHISPLLFSDPADDDRAVNGLIARFDLPAQAVADATSSPGSADRWRRVGTYLLAIAALALGILMFGAILWYIRGRG